MKASFCPHCGEPLELDPDGGYCQRCGEYFENAELEEAAEEEE